MRKTVILVLLLTVLFSSCDKKNKIKTSGEDKLNSEKVLEGSTYSIPGFSFESGSVILYNPATSQNIPDIFALPSSDAQGNVTGAYFDSQNINKSFALADEFSTPDSALNFFNDYKQDFMVHISEEEEKILPYILELEEQSTREKPDPEFIESLKNYSIREFEKEHDRLETSLENLSRLIIKYLPPFEDFQLCNQMLSDLATLVKDLIDHANMEDKVLIPRVFELEKQLLQKYASV